MTEHETIPEEWLRACLDVLDLHPNTQARRHIEELVHGLLTELEKRPTWDEFYEWLSGAYAAGWTMGTSGVPTEMRETLAHNHAQDAVLAMQQKREKE